LSTTEIHDRPYMQSRIREEVARAKRHGRTFGIAVFEVRPSASGVPIRKRMEIGIAIVCQSVRACDTVAKTFDDTIVALLVETDARGMRDAMLRVQSRIAKFGGAWQVTIYHFPEQADAIETLPLLSAA
jgi:hypothetical protein